MRMWPEGQGITRSSDGGESIAAKKFHRNAAGKACEIEFEGLRKTREIHHNQNRFVFGAAQKGEHF